MHPFRSCLAKICLFLSGLAGMPNASYSQKQTAPDSIKVKLLDVIVVTASKQAENLLQSPVSIERLDSKAIQQTAQPSFFDALQNLKGLQVITPGMGFKVINARCFANTTNVRFVRLVDGIDNQAPHIGASIANSLGPNNLDIAAVEVLPGSASALYGMNAINGIANFIQQGIRSKKEWTKLKDGMGITEFEYRSHDWKHPRRMVAVRKNIEILTKATGNLLLFDEPVGKYRYSLYVTNLELPAEQVWISYKDRADAENRIKKLKHDFGLDSFCMDKFWATEAAFRTIMMGYNLMSLFRQIVLQSKSQATLSTLRFKCFALEVGKHAGKKTLNVSAIGEKRIWLDGLFDIIQAIVKMKLVNGGATEKTHCLTDYGQQLME